MFRTFAVSMAFSVLLGFNTAIADEPLTKTVEALFSEKTELAGKTVQVHGKVVKVNNGVMNRNFLHLQDGTGAEGSNDLTVTSQQTANIGDKVTITGVVAVDRDFGFGYEYPLLMEEASIAAAEH